MRWLIVAILACITYGAAAKDRITARWLVDLFSTCSENRWIIVPTDPDFEVTCVPRRRVRT